MNWTKIETAIRLALEGLNNDLGIKDTSEYPLAFHVGMPEGHPYPNGHIGFRFCRFAATGLPGMRLDTAKCSIDDHRIRLCMEWKEIVLTASYSINARKAPVIDLDTAGTLLEWGDQRDLLKTAGAPAGKAPNLDPKEQTQFLDTARTQRTRLMDTPNGRQLMGIYNEHNEVYHEVFTNSEATRDTWVAGGATAQMARDTHEAVQDNGVVNSATKTYPGHVTYNANAFVQQLNICVNTAGADPNFDPWDPHAKPDPKSKYIKASLAALNFGKAVKTTGNDNRTVTPLTSEQVYTQMNSYTQAPPRTEIGELQNILSQGANGAGAEAATEKGWLILDEEQRKMVRRWIHLNIREKAERERTESSPLWEGGCTARFGPVFCTMDLLFPSEEGVAAAGEAEIKCAELHVPVFELDVDDAAWTGPAADVARDRLARLYFVKSLIRHQVVSGISTMTTLAVKKAFNPA